MKRFLPLVLCFAALTAHAARRAEPGAEAAPAPVVRLPTADLPKLLIEEVAYGPGLAEIANGDEAPAHSGLSDALAPETARDAVSAELQGLGWPTTENAAFAGARLKATIVKARLRWTQTFWQGQRLNEANIRVVLTLTDAGGRDVWEAPLEARISPNLYIGGGGNWIPAGCGLALKSALSRLGPLLAKDRPWELLGKDRGAPAAAAAAPAPAESDVDQLPAAVAARPKTYAVVIGIERYREKLPNADFAASDARLAAKYFERALGVPEANVAVLTDDRATKSDFEKYFERWLPNRVEPGDTVYVYYSGHGAPDPAKGDAYLVPYDGDPTYIEQTGYPVKRLFDQLAKLPAKQVYVAMDSCFSGAGGRSVIAQGARPLVSVVQDAVPAKLAVLAASAGNQISNSYQEKGHGLFTYYFLKGIKEKGGDFHAVFDYLKPEVARVARRDYNADQEPEWRQGR